MSGGSGWDERTPEEVWVRNWANLAWRYRKNPTIIGVSAYTVQYCTVQYFTVQYCVCMYALTA